MAPKLAWIGLGNMGRGMCANLCSKGNLADPLIIFNRTKKRAEDLSSRLGEGKSIVADSIQDAVSKADIVFTCVGDDTAVNETIKTAVQSDVTGKLFVDCSTIHPETTFAIADLLKQHGAEFVACPVFGAPAMADAGQLICVLAGPAKSVDKVKPYTTGVMGRAIIDFSDQDLAVALKLKVIGNTLILNMVESLAEAHTLAEKSGLGSDNLHKAIEQLFPGPYTAYSDRMRHGDYYTREEPLFAVDLARKDAKHARALAKESGMQMQALEVADNHLVHVKDHMGEKGDIASIYGAVRKESGLPFEN